MECFKRILATAIIAMLSTASIAQITSGKIIYERRTNLKKTVGDNPRASRFITDENKIRKENFELAFNETSSVFEFIENDEVEEGGMMKMLTQRNKVYQNLEDEEFFMIMNSWGQEMLLKDSLSERTWKITENKRKFAGHMCRKAIWEQNDSTRIYAWFSPDIVPSIGPEGYCGLPGVILGLATEDGGIVYFAKKIEFVNPTEEELRPDFGKNDVFTLEQLKVKIEKDYGNTPWGKKMFDDLFRWL